MVKKITVFFSLTLMASVTVAEVPYTKKWNFVNCICANNNLYRYGLQNIKEMEMTGSTPYINIFVQRDNYGKKEVVRYKIEKNQQRLLSLVTTPPESVTGTVENIYGFVRDILPHSPADHLALTIWGHGSGAKDPQLWMKNYAFDRDECFFYNQETKLFELKKDLFDSPFFRGIGFNDVGHVYITNPDLKNVLDRISSELLNGKKIDILGLDACHMSMIEICSQVKSAVNYLVGSEEIEPGTSWGYTTLFQPFLQNSLTPEDFAKQMVDSYDEKYNQSFADFTQSAIRLDMIPQLEKNIDMVATLLIKLLAAKGFYNTLAGVRKSPSETITFLDHDYIDLSFFYKRFLLALQRTTFEKNIEQIGQLKQLLKEGEEAVSACVIKNATGRNVKNAGGLAIYFPTRNVHSSYAQTEFAKTTNWCNFLIAYLSYKGDSKMEVEENLS